MSHAWLHQNAGITPEETSKLLTVSEMFTTVPIEAILTKLRQNQWHVETTIDKILEGLSKGEFPIVVVPKTQEKQLEQQPIKQQPQISPQSPIQHPQQVPNASSFPPLVSSSPQTPTDLNTSTKMTSSQAGGDKERLFSIKKLQEQLEKVYESSFEVMEKKITEQQTEIDSLKKLLADKDQEIQNLKDTNINLKDTLVLTEKSLTYYKKRIAGDEVVSSGITDIKKNFDQALDASISDGQEPDGLLKNFVQLFKRKLAMELLAESQQQGGGSQMNNVDSNDVESKWVELPKDPSNNTSAQPQQPHQQPPISPFARATAPPMGGGGGVVVFGQQQQQQQPQPQQYYVPPTGNYYPPQNIYPMQPQTFKFNQPPPNNTGNNNFYPGTIPQRN